MWARLVRDLMTLSLRRMGHRYCWDDSVFCGQKWNFQGG